MECETETEDGDTEETASHKQRLLWTDPEALSK